MKLIALKNFARIPELQEMEIPHGEHPGQVDKGTQFAIGGETPLKDLPKEQKRMVAQLFIAGAVGEPTPRVLEQIEAEKARERSRQENHLKLTAAAVNAAVAGHMRELSSLLQQSGR